MPFIKGIISWNKGKKLSEKHKKKLRQSHLGKIPWNKGIKTGLVPKTAFKKGYKETKETKEKRIQAMIGHECSEETRKKIGIASFKGDNAGKQAMHDWVKKYKGKAFNYICEICKKRQASNWANKKHDYKRILDDYMTLCVSCHRKYDIKYNLNKKL